MSEKKLFLREVIAFLVLGIFSLVIFQYCVVAGAVVGYSDKWKLTKNARDIVETILLCIPFIVIVASSIAIIAKTYICGKKNIEN